MIGSNQQYGAQTTEVKDNFTDEEFNRYIVWDDSIVTDDTTSKTGWYKFNPDTYVEFLASKCPYEKNIRRNLTWNYNSLIKEQNGPWYYASDGESVWEIAKHYAVSCQAVMSENELTDGTVTSPTMLLIPNM